MPKPLLIIINGPPGAGKTTLAKRLAADLSLPVIHRDSVSEAMFDALESQIHGRPVMIGPASFTMMHYFAGLLLAAHRSLIIEGSFYNSALATSEFLRLKQAHDFEPLQIQCKADGTILLERFLARIGTSERHPYHRDLEFVQNNKEVILGGRLSDLDIGGQIVEIDTTDIANLDYAGLLLLARMTLERFY